MDLGDLDRGWTPLAIVVADAEGRFLDLGVDEDNGLVAVVGALAQLVTNSRSPSPGLQ